MSRRSILFVFYFLVGVSNTIYDYAFLMDLRDYDISLSTLSYISVVPFFPWGLKCLTTAFADTVKCFGLNQKPYIVINNVLSAMFCFVMLLPSLTLSQYIGVFFGMQFFASWASTNYDAIMIYEGNLESASTEGRLQLRCNICKCLGRIIGYGCGPLIWNEIGSPGVFGIMTICFWLSVIFCLCMDDIPQSNLSAPARVVKSLPLDAQGRVFENDDFDTTPDPKHSCSFSLGLVSHSIRNPFIRPIMLYVVVSGCIPSVGKPTFFFLNDVVRLTPGQFSWLRIIGECTGIVANVMFDNLFIGFSLRTIYIMTGVLKIAVGMMPYILSVKATRDYTETCTHYYMNETRSNETCYYYEQHKLDPFGLAIGENVLGEVLDDIQYIPLSIVTRAISYHAMGPTVFQVIGAIGNIVSVIGNYVSSSCMAFVGIDHDHFAALPDLSLFCVFLDTVWSVLGICLLFGSSLSLRDIREKINSGKVNNKEEIQTFISNTLSDTTVVGSSEIAPYASATVIPVQSQVREYVV